MKEWRFLVRVVVAFAGLAVNAPALEAVDSSVAAGQLQEAFVSVAKQVGPAVVSISTIHTERVRSYYVSPYEDEFTRKFFSDFFGEVPYREFKRIGLGSGFIIDSKGYILTNDHVVGDADQIHVTLADGREFQAKVNGRDSMADLAVIQIPAKGLPVAQLGNSDSVQTGEWAIAIGNPFGFAMTNPEPTVTVGVVSALNRSLSRGGKEQDFTDLIQTDAAINPGNSGGPLVNLKGEVIGINVAIFTTSGGYQGIGFAIPVNRAKAILDDLIEGRKVRYGWLGVSIQDVNKDVVAYFGVSDMQGVIVAQVLEGGPADQGGIKAGDVIRLLDGEPIKNTRALIGRVSQAKIGQEIEVKVLRQKKEIALKMKVGDRPANSSSQPAAQKLPREVSPSIVSWRGMEVQNLTAAIKQELRITDDTGVVVTQVNPDSPSYRSGIRVGDVILELNRTPVRNQGYFEEITSQMKGDALIRTPRGYVVVKPE